MAKIDRFNGNVAPFASQADTNKRTTFGTTDTGLDTLDDNVTADFLTGWQIVGPNDFPTLEDFNALGFTVSQFLSYLHQAGVPEWNGTQQYQIGSYVNLAGVLYVCKTADHVSVSSPSGDVVNWGGLNEQFVALTGPQSIDDIKTFTSSPIVPTPTAGTDDTKAATTAFVKAKSELDSIGVNQTWQDLTASRSPGVSYTNSTGKPIEVKYYFDVGGLAELSVNGLVVERATDASDAAGDENNHTISAIIPSGSSYNITTGVTPASEFWRELR